MPTLFKTADWQCALECGRCDHVKPGGVRCRNRVCVGTPTCWVHTAALYGVRAKTSTIAGAGKGLFATRDFAANEWICPYVGEAIGQACLDARYPGDVTAPYVEMLPGGRGYVDSACMRGIGSLANALFTNAGRCRSLGQHNAKASFRRGLGQTWLKTTKRVARGAEIFHYYGAAYRLEDGHVTKSARGADTRPC